MGKVVLTTEVHLSYTTERIAVGTYRLILCTADATSNYPSCPQPASCGPQPCLIPFPFHLALEHCKAPTLLGRSTMENTFDKTAVETIDLLEARLRRIEYALGGSQVQADSKLSAARRITNLEHTLHQLASKSSVVQDLLRLRKY